MRGIIGDGISLPSSDELRDNVLTLHKEPKLMVYGKAPTHVFGLRCLTAIRQRLGNNLIEHYDIGDNSQIGYLSESEILSD
jgi:hypothetical protein